MLFNTSPCQTSTGLKLETIKQCRGFSNKITALLLEYMYIYIYLFYIFYFLNHTNHHSLALILCSQTYLIHILFTCSVASMFVSTNLMSDMNHALLNNNKRKSIELKDISF